MSHEPNPSCSRIACKRTCRGSTLLHPVCRDTGLSMGSGMRLGLLAITLYLAALGFVWIWFHPHFVSMRVHERISAGASASDVEREFQVRTYDFPGSAYCGKDSPPNVTRIAIGEASRMPLLPLPMAMVTTTVFCFDGHDRLVGMKTERWFDDL